MCFHLDKCARKIKKHRAIASQQLQQYVNDAFCKTSFHARLWRERSWGSPRLWGLLATPMADGWNERRKSRRRSNTGCRGTLKTKTHEFDQLKAREETLAESVNHRKSLESTPSSAAFPSCEDKLTAKKKELCERLWHRKPELLVEEDKKWIVWEGKYNHHITEFLHFR